MNVAMNVDTDLECQVAENSNNVNINSTLSYNETIFTSISDDPNWKIEKVVASVDKV